MVRTENKKLISRLSNWKFKSALQHLDGESDDVKEVVTALANVFDNIGWSEGDMGTIIGACVRNICPETEE